MDADSVSLETQAAIDILGRDTLAEPVIKSDNGFIIHCNGVQINAEDKQPDTETHNAAHAGAERNSCEPQ